MAQIRRKTVSDRRDDFRYAREKGIDLSWNRYENMLPQDGFGRLGLACFDCLMGPCRLNPFARQEERTVCGFTPDDLAYRSLMRLMGVPTAAGCHFESIRRAAEEWSAPDGVKRDGTYRIGPGVLDPGKPNVCLERGVGPVVAEKLSGAGLNVVTVGTLEAGYGCASALCEVEFLLLTGLVDAVVPGPGGISVAYGVAESLHTAFVCGRDPDGAIAAAKEAFSKRGEVRPDSAVKEVQAVSLSDALQQAGDGAVILGGEGSIKTTLDELACDAIKVFQEKERPVIVCGGMVPALAKYDLDGVIWCADPVGALLLAGKKLPVLMPGLSTRYGVAEAIALGVAGVDVLTATELPLGYGELGEKLGKLVRYVTPDEYIAAAKGV